MDLTLNIIVLSGNNVRNNVMCSNMIFIKVTVGWDGFLICIKKFFPKMNHGELNLNISTLNVNSFNVSTMGGKMSKTFIKIEGVTGKKADILFMCDCRMGRKGKEVEKMFNLSRNGNIRCILIQTQRAGGWQSR